MPYSTCCGAHTNFPEIDICPDCLEHCDWEDEDEDEDENEPLNELKYIANVLEWSQEYNMVPEVIWSALQAMKQDPSISIQEAMLYGYNEWIK